MVDLVVGFNGKAHFVVNAHIMAIGKQPAPCAVDKKFLRKLNHIGTHAIGIAPGLSETINVGNQPQLAGKMVRAVGDFLSDETVVLRATNWLKLSSID